MTDEEPCQKQLPRVCRFPQSRYAKERGKNNCSVAIAPSRLYDQRPTRRCHRACAIRERLAQFDPGTRRQRDLSVSFNKVGNVHEMQGDLASALKS